MAAVDLPVPGTLPAVIGVRGARHNNLQDVDVDEVGLGHLRLGQSTPSLSGGESQRLRIASGLRSSHRGAL